jgi:hypothetical protein
MHVPACFQPQGLTRRTVEPRIPPYDDAPPFAIKRVSPPVHVLPENGAPHPFAHLFRKGATESALIIGDSQKVLAQMPAAVFPDSTGFRGW